MQPINGGTKKSPDFVDVGESVKLVSLSALAQAFRVSEAFMGQFLDDLGVPWMEFPDGTQYVSLFAVEQALFAALRCGEPSFDASRFKFVPTAKYRRATAFEMGLASLTYSGAARDALRNRVAEIGKSYQARLKKQSKKSPKKS